MADKKAPRKSAKVADLEALEKKLMEANVKIADIGKIADQITDLFTDKENSENAYSTDIETALVKIEAILALVRGEDLGEWARARIGL